VFVLLFVLFCSIPCALSACTCGQYNECSCLTSLPYPFSQSATINITFYHGMLSFQQIFGYNTLNTFTFQGNYLTPQGAVCVATQEVGWCVLLENFSNNGRYSSGTITSTFVKLGTVWTGNHGTFKISSTVTDDPPSGGNPPPPASQFCINQCPGAGSQECNCRPGDGCYCCANWQSNGCTQLAGVPMLQYLQSTVVFDGVVWFMSSSQVVNPEWICTVSSQVQGTLCLSFKDLDFTSNTISGNAEMVYATQHASNQTSLGFFRITS